MAHPECPLPLIALRDVLKYSPLVTFFWSAFVCSFMLCRNEILCFASYINHSSALYCVTDAINATSWQRENQRIEGEKERIFSVPFLFSLPQQPYHLYWSLEIGPWTCLSPLEGKQTCFVAGEEWLKEEGWDIKEAKQTKEMARGKKKNIFIVSAYKEELS